MSTNQPRQHIDTWEPGVSSDSHSVIWPYGATFGAGVVASVRITNRTRGVLYVKRGPDGDTPSATNRDWTVGAYQDSTMPLGDIGVRYGWEGLPGPDAEVTTVLTTDPQPVGAAAIPASFVPTQSIVTWQPLSVGSPFTVPVPAGLGSIGTVVIDNGCWRYVGVTIGGVQVGSVAPMGSRAFVAAGQVVELSTSATPYPEGVVSITVSPDVQPVSLVDGPWPLHQAPYTESLQDTVSLSGIGFNAGAGVWVDAWAFPFAETTVLTGIEATLQIVRSPVPAAVAYQTVEIGLLRGFSGTTSRKLLGAVSLPTHGTQPAGESTMRLRGPLIVRDAGGSPGVNYLSYRFMAANPADAFAAQIVVNAHGWRGTV